MQPEVYLPTVSMLRVRPHPLSLSACPLVAQKCVLSRSEIQGGTNF